MHTPPSVSTAIEYKYARAEVETAFRFLRILQRNVVYLEAAQLDIPRYERYFAVIEALMGETLDLLEQARDRFDFIIKQRKSILVEDDHGRESFTLAEIEMVDELFPQAAGNSGDVGANEAGVGDQVPFRLFSDPYTAENILVPVPAIDRLKAHRLSNGASSFDADVHGDSVNDDFDPFKDAAGIHCSSSLVGGVHDDSKPSCSGCTCHATKEEPATEDAAANAGCGGLDGKEVS